MHQLGIMSSGFPGKFLAIMQAIVAGDLVGVEVGAVVCNRTDDDRIIEAARQRGVSNSVIDARDPAVIDAKARDIFLSHKVDLVLLSGYGKKIGSSLLEAFPDRIINIHGGPLPRFGGKGMVKQRTQEAVMAANVKYSGPTVHLVDEDYDTGTVLGHWPVAVRSDDTPESLNARCLEAGNLLCIREIRDFYYRLDHAELF